MTPNVDWSSLNSDYNGGMEDTTTENEESKRLTSREEVQTALGEKRDLSGMDLSGLDLSGMKFTALNAAGIDLSGAELDGAVIAAANMDHANFQGANLRRAKFQMANLGSADFSGADLRDTLWLATNVSDADFSDSETAGAKSSAVSWVAAKTLPAEMPAPLLSTPRWAPFAVLGLAGSLLAFLFFRRRRKSDYISLDDIE